MPKKRPYPFDGSLRSVAFWLGFYLCALFFLGILLNLDHIWNCITSKTFWLSLLSIVVIGGGYNAYKLNAKKPEEL